MIGPGERRRVLLATARDWLAASIEGVVEDESIEIQTASTVDKLEEMIRRARPDEVLLDQELAGRRTPELCERLTQGVLGADVPLIVYSSELRNEDLETRAVEAGAWTVMQEPIRSQYLVATLYRFLQVGRLSREEMVWPEARTDGARVLDRAGVLRRLPMLEALARRYESPLSIVAVGPRKPGGGDLRRRQRRGTAELCMKELRKADVIGWLDDDGDVVIVAYGASRSGARSLAERLADRAAERSEIERPERALSIGIVELRPGGESEAEPRELTTPEGVDELIEAASDALERARTEGGGIEIAS